MKKFIIPSLILVLLSSLSLFFISEETLQPPDYISWPITLLTLISYLFILRRYKLIYNEGTASFGSLFKYGLLITVIYSFTASIIHLIHFKLIDESVHKKVINNAIEKIREQQINNTGYSSASFEKNMTSMMSFMYNPYITSILKLLWFIIVGLLYTLIGAAVFKGKKQDPCEF